MTAARILSLIQSLLSRFGYVTAQATDKQNILALIDDLKPYETDKTLIRCGADGEGGYLIPDDIEGIAACFSPGVGAFSTFEEACAQKGLQVFMADFSVDAPNIKNDRFHFTKKFIGTSTSGNYITMEDWMKENLKGDTSDLLLQMDIEGQEYLAIVSMPDELLHQCRIIVIEFHYMGKLWNKEFFHTAQAAFQKVLRHHTCVHIHPNNYCGVETIQGIDIPRAAEFTFLRNDRISKKKFRSDFPHKLDFDNIRNNPIILPKCWYN